MKTCLDAVSAANGDSCYCDSSTSTNESFPNVPTEKLQEWDKGLLELTKEVQQQLGDNN